MRLKEDVRKIAINVKTLGGYVLVTGGEVSVNAKLDNLRAIVRTVEKYGRY